MELRFEGLVVVASWGAIGKGNFDVWCRVGVSRLVIMTKSSEETYITTVDRLWFYIKLHSALTQVIYKG